jgi:hypothetical protein
MKKYTNGYIVLSIIFHITCIIYYCYNPYNEHIKVISLAHISYIMVYIWKCVSIFSPHEIFDSLFLENNQCR